MTTESPKRVADLFRAITGLTTELTTTERRLVALVGNIALSQMLPDSAIKGGTGLKLRFGERSLGTPRPSTPPSVATSMPSGTSWPRSSPRGGVGSRAP